MIQGTVEMHCFYYGRAATELFTVRSSSYNHAKIGTQHLRGAFSIGVGSGRGRVGGGGWSGWSNQYFWVEARYSFDQPNIDVTLWRPCGTHLPSLNHAKFPTGAVLGAVRTINFNNLAL